nr:PfkB family carbohydrate kinase [Corynebacterium xerosis]
MIVVGGEMLVDLVPVAGTGAAGAAGPDLRPHLGGGPFNVAIAAGRQGAEVGFLSRLSTDAYGRAGWRGWPKPASTSPRCSSARSRRRWR